MKHTPSTLLQCGAWCEQASSVEGERKLKRLHLMRRWGLCVLLTWRTPAALEAAAGNVGAVCLIHRTHPGNFYGQNWNLSNPKLESYRGLINRLCYAVVQ